MKLKAERAASDIQKELGNIIFLEAKDVDFKNVTITAVDVSNDLSYAKVYFTCLQDDKREEITEALNKASPFIRKCIAPKFDILKVPEFKFVYDTSLEYGKHIDEIIDKIHEEE